MIARFIPKILRLSRNVIKPPDSKQFLSPAYSGEGPQILDVHLKSGCSFEHVTKLSWVLRGIWPTRIAFENGNYLSRI